MTNKFSEIKNKLTKSQEKGLKRDAVKNVVKNPKMVHGAGVIFLLIAAVMLIMSASSRDEGRRR